MLKRWRARSKPAGGDSKKSKAEEPADPKMDARLDAELRALDD
jgi:hypothetical protein